MTCIDAFAIAQDFADFWCLDPICEDERQTIQTFLDISAADIHAALAAVGACDCTLADWASEYLKKLNIIEAMVIHNCPCGRTHVSDEMKRTWLEWLDRQFDAIRTSKVDVCDGATAADYPHMTWAQQSLTAWNAARIVYDDLLRDSG
jgi:hypothetical protein